MSAESYNGTTVQMHKLLLAFDGYQTFASACRSLIPFVAEAAGAARRQHHAQDDACRRGKG